MAASSLQILQSIRNRLDTAESGWLDFAEACTQGYDAAYTQQKNALDLAKVAATQQADQAWKVLSIMLTVAGAPWVPRFLTPIETFAGKGVDRLTASWMADAIKAGGAELKSGISGSVLDQFKNYVGSTGDAFTPVVDTTTNYSSRLREGIYKRAKEFKSKMDDVVEEADRWTEAAALSLRNGFFTGCPFLTDLPKDTSDKFKKKFQDEAELSMWVEWAIARDEAYWVDQQDGGWWDPYGNDKRHAFDPIRSRLVVLGVPPDVTNGTFLGQSGHPSNWLPPLDMVKLIRWAKNRSRSQAAQQVCKQAEPPSPLRLKENQAVCRVSP
jgi:hypothetical protein